MTKQSVRVVLASEFPETRYLLKEIVEGEQGTVIIGQAENATKALTLTKNLRPDVAIVDSSLPFAVGLDSVPLSRIGGLDAAQAISEEMPNTRVVLLSNLDAGLFSGHDLDSSLVAVFARKTNGSTAPFTLRELYQQTLPLKAPVFANVEVRRQAALRQKLISISDKAVLAGGLAILGGLFLTLTVVLAGSGIFLALAGAAALLLGLAGKLANRFWPKRRDK